MRNGRMEYGRVGRSELEVGRGSRSQEKRKMRKEGKDEGAEDGMKLPYSFIPSMEKMEIVRQGDFERG